MLYFFFRILFTSHTPKLRCIGVVLFSLKLLRYFWVYHAPPLCSSNLRCSICEQGQPTLSVCGCWGLGGELQLKCLYKHATTLVECWHMLALEAVNLHGRQQAKLNSQERKTKLGFTFQIFNCDHVSALAWGFKMINSPSPGRCQGQARCCCCCRDTNILQRDLPQRNGTASGEMSDFTLQLPFIARVT